MKRIISLFISLIFVLSTSNLLFAEKLCIRKVQKIKSNKVRLSKILTTDTECPRRTVEILDTAVFKGDTGAQGPAGQNATDNLTTEQTSNAAINVAHGSTVLHESGCSSSDQKVISGGCNINHNDMHLVDSYLNTSNGLWRCIYANYSGSSLLAKVTVIANCVDN